MGSPHYMPLGAIYSLSIVSYPLGFNVYRGIYMYILMIGTFVMAYNVHSNYGPPYGLLGLAYEWRTTFLGLVALWASWCRRPPIRRTSPASPHGFAQIEDSTMSPLGLVANSLDFMLRLCPSSSPGSFTRGESLGLQLAPCGYDCSDGFGRFGRRPS